MMPVRSKTFDLDATGDNDSGDVQNLVASRTSVHTKANLGYVKEPMSLSRNDYSTDIAMVSDRSFMVNLQQKKNAGYADLSQAVGITINDLRKSVAFQRMLERDARGGTRYTEIISTHFGVKSEDSRLDRPEYLSGSHTSLNIDQVLQTSSTDNTSPQANVSGNGLTSGTNAEFDKSITEHGAIIGVCCVRNEHSYSQGIERF